MKILSRLFLPAMLCLSSCSSGVYKYIPPEGDVGKRCVENCVNFRTDCENQEKHRAEFCDKRQELILTNCKARMQLVKNPDPIENQCLPTENCIFSTSHCDLGYRHCFNACGGTIEEQ